MQGPGGPQEDTSNGFKFGGWTTPFSDDGFGKALNDELSKQFDMLLGRKTYEIFASYWPFKTGFIAEPFNKAKKYLVSNGNPELSWKETELITGDVVSKIKELKNSGESDIQVWGSGELMQTLLKNDLVDELRLRIHPVTIGNWKW